MFQLKQIVATGVFQLVRVNTAGTALEVAPGITIASGGAIQTTGVGTGAVTGNARGVGAVDLQTSRSAATQVASGQSAFAIGNSNTASGNTSICAGFNNVASGSTSIAMGGNNTASGTAAVTLGDLNTASANYTLATGRLSIASRFGEQAHAAGQFAAAGDAQTNLLIIRGTTTNATLTEIASPTRITLADDSTVTFCIYISARRTDADNESAGFQIEGCIDRNSGAATTALVGAVTPVVLARDNAAWSVTVDADTTNGALRIRVQGEASKTIRWVAMIRLVEVVG